MKNALFIFKYLSISIYGWEFKWEVIICSKFVEILNVYIEDVAYESEKSEDQLRRAPKSSIIDLKHSSYIWALDNA